MPPTFSGVFVLLLDGVVKSNRFTPDGEDALPVPGVLNRLKKLRGDGV